MTPEPFTILVDPRLESGPFGEEGLVPELDRGL